MLNLGSLWSRTTTRRVADDVDGREAECWRLRLCEGDFERGRGDDCMAFWGWVGKSENLLAQKKIKLTLGDLERFCKLTPTEE